MDDKPWHDWSLLQSKVGCKKISDQSDMNIVNARLMEAKGSLATRYRYRTPVLTGRWRDSSEEALRDAIASRQVREDPEAPEGFRWIVPGQIEEAEDERDLLRRIGRH